MKRLYPIFGIILLFTQLSTGFCAPTGKLAITLNKKTALVGSPIKMHFSLSANGIKSVTWALCDAAFGNYELLHKRDTNPPGLFMHEITFTSIKPGYFKIKELAVIVNHSNGTRDTLKSPPDSIYFKSDRMTAYVNGLKPNSSPQITISKPVIVLIILIGVAIAGFFILKGKEVKPEMTKQELRSHYLQKLAALETDAETNTLQAEPVYNLLTNFLRQVHGLNEADLPGAIKTLDIDDGRALADIISQSEKLRFQPHTVVAGVVAIYLQQVKQFIIYFQSQKIDQAV